MRIYFFSFWLFSITQIAQAVPLSFNEFDVRFTNPQCESQDAPSTHCSQAHLDSNLLRTDTPHFKILEWIADSATEEVFITSMSFSNAQIERELCKASVNRGVRVTVVLDTETDFGVANRLKKCTGGISPPNILERGNQGGLGIHHNKLIVVNPSRSTMKIGYSSANFSSFGTVLHHENWSFVTLPSDTYFAQVHVCLIEGLTHHSLSRKDFSSFLDGCRAEIPYEEEHDIKSFFVPADNKKALNALIEMVESSQTVKIAAHRFTLPILFTTLASKLAHGNNVQLIADDDLYWALKGKIIGGNSKDEAVRLRPLLEAGIDVKYINTNHKIRQFHHNKFIIADNAVFAGAGNFSAAAFSANFENFYLVKIPEVVDAYKLQYERLWSEGLSDAQMPVSPF